MTVSAAMLAEFAKPGGEFYKRLTVSFPPTTETITLLPDATELTDANHTVVVAATVHEALDDPVDSPDTTTYVRHDANDTRGESRVSFPDLPTWVQTVEEVRLYCRAVSQQTAGAEDDDGGWLFALRIGSTNYYGAVENSRFFNPDYRTMVIRFPLSPATGAQWTIAEANGMQGAIIGQPDDQGDLFGQRFTQMYALVDVTRSQVGRYSDVAINSRADGLFEAKVLSWQSVTYSVEGSSNAIQRPRCAARIADPDETLGQLFAAGGVDDVRRSSVTIEYVSPNVPRADWFTVFTGILEKWDDPSPLEWDLFFAMDDSSLDGRLPKSNISEQDFADADPKEFEKAIPVIYGIHDSVSGGTDDGMVSCLNVDQVLWRRAVCAHHVFDLPRVYSKGNKEDPALLRTEGTSAGTAETAEYQIITPVIGGRQWTLIQFNLTGQSQEEIDKFNELTISCDVTGIEDVGDGTGFPLVNPSTIWKHAYVNWVHGDYGAGAWLDDSTAPVDLDLFAECAAFFTLVGQSASRRIGGEKQGKTSRTELNAFTKDLNVKVFWTEEGKLGILPHSPFTLTVYKNDPWFQQGLHDLEDPVYDSDITNLHDRILLSYFHQANGDSFLATIEMRDLEAGDQKLDTTKSFWLPSGL